MLIKQIDLCIKIEINAFVKGFTVFYRDGPIENLTKYFAIKISSFHETNCAKIIRLLTILFWNNILLLVEERWLESNDVWYV